jgi:hypothetical protein
MRTLCQGHLKKDSHETSNKYGCIIFGVGEGILSETEIAHLK